MRAAILVLLLATDGGPSLGLPPSLRRALAGSWDSTPAGFRPIALSLTADACAAAGLRHPALVEDARACVAGAVREVRRLVSPSSPDALKLTHLALALGAADRLGPCVDAPLHREVSERLAKMSLADPLAHAPSYAGRAERWPADQVATLASLARFDRAHGETLADAPLARWKAVMATRLHDGTGLPRSELAGTARSSASLPRGCAQSFIARYLPEVEPGLASQWWTAYREHFLVRPAPLVVGFREWPRGVARAADVDSGPIVMGVGSAASALGIAAARASGDEVLATELEASADLAIAAGAGGTASQTALAAAIRLAGRWQPRLVAPSGR